tara:strand:- start:1200 stop:1352 length:153 start_codon:yes stop_codon:yes gene_type:complete
MQPQFLLVKPDWIDMITKKQIVLNHENPTWPRLEPGMLAKQLMWIDQKVM